MKIGGIVKSRICRFLWIPAFAGMTKNVNYQIYTNIVIPAKAGIQSLERLFTSSSKLNIYCILSSKFMVC
jgi:hypothetical protein